MSNLSDRVALVTGAGRGIGRAVAVALAAAGAPVALLARTRSEIEEAAREIEARAGRACVLAADVTDDDALDAALAHMRSRLGEAQILVNNAGWAPPRTPLQRTCSADVERMLATNLRAPILLARRLLPSMLERGGGWILNVSSAFALRPHTGEAVYAATKAGLLAFSYALAAECAPRGVRVAALCPGFVDTSFIPPNRRTDRSRFLRPEAVAAAAIDFLHGRYPTDQIEIVLESMEASA